MAKISTLLEQQLAEAGAELRGLINGRDQRMTVINSPQVLTDYGGIVYKKPAIIVQPISVADVSATLKLAKKYSLPLSIRGAGHSCRGQSLCEGGITLLNTTDIASYCLLDDHCVEVTTRTNWAQLSTELARENLIPRVLTSHHGVTIGGTLSAGGYGLQSVAYGGQIDQVERLLLVKPDGEPVWCSPTEHPHLFAYSLSGLGQVGFIEKAVLRLRSAPDDVSWFLYRHPCIDELVESIAWLEELSGDTIYGFSAVYLFGNHAFSLYGVERPCWGEFVRRLPHLLQHKSYRRITEPPAFRDDASMSGLPSPFCPAADYLLSYNQLAAFLHVVNELWVRHELQRFTPYCLVHAIRPSQSHLYPFAATNFDDPLSMKYLVGIYPMIPANAAGALAEVQYVLRLLLEACIAANGRPYLYGWHDLNDEMKQKLYGNSYKAWQTLCQQLDPDSILRRSL